MEKGVQVASVAGYVTRVNRLITVTPLRQVYQGRYITGYSSHVLSDCYEWKLLHFYYESHAIEIPIIDSYWNCR